MKIQELEQGTELSLEIVWGESTYEIPSKIVLSMAGRVFVQSFTYKGKTLDLTNPSFSGMVFNIYAPNPKTGKRLVWRSVTLEMREVKEKIYYEIKTSTFRAEGQEVERRDAFRIKINLPGAVVIPDEGREIDVIIYDFSREGIAFTYPKDLKLVGGLVKVYFQEQLRDHFFEIKVTARCVRKKAGDRYLYGCHIRTLEREAAIYLNQKTLEMQMEAIDAQRRATSGGTLPMGPGTNLFNIGKMP
ncbi:MAG: PilZ domain-containing protein [Lachnospiraceae bacterium]|nr:PilZ domain-containing protein [Lachnospiraceae bacterium]